MFPITSHKYVYYVFMGNSNQLIQFQLHHVDRTALDCDDDDSEWNVFVLSSERLKSCRLVLILSWGRFNRCSINMEEFKCLRLTASLSAFPLHRLLHHHHHLRYCSRLKMWYLHTISSTSKSNISANACGIRIEDETLRHQHATRFANLMLTHRTRNTPVTGLKQKRISEWNVIFPLHGLSASTALVLLSSLPADSAASAVVSITCFVFPVR